MRHSEIEKKMGLAIMKIKGSSGSGELHVQVKVIDYRWGFGKDRWLVTPVNGSGKRFVETGTLVWEDK